MTSSLILAGYELCSTGPVFAVMDGSYDRGAPQPITSEQASDLVDGSRVVGDRAANRQWQISVAVTGPDTLSRISNVNTILQTVNSTIPWTLEWTPDGGLTVEFVCQRGSARIVSSLILENGFQWQILSLTFSSLPYARSPQPVTLTMSTASQQLDSYDTLPTVATVSGTLIDAEIQGGPGTFEGTGMLKVASSGPVVATVSRTGLTVDPTGLPILQLRTNVSPYPQVNGIINLQMSMAVTGLSGVVYDTPVRTASNPKGQWATRTWSLGAAIPRTGANAGLPVGVTEQVTAYQATITMGGTVYASGGGTFGSRYAQPYGENLHVDDLRAVPGGGVGASDGAGGMYLIPQIVGTARTPINLALTLPNGTPFSSWAVHSPPSDTPQVQPYVPLTAVGGQIQGSGYGYDGSYSAYVAPRAASGTTARTVTLTATQTGMAAGYPTQTTSISTSYTPPAAGGLIYLGEINLPILAVPDPRTQQVTFTVTSSAGVADTFAQLLLFDSRGQTVMCRSGPTVPFVWINEPDGSRIGAVVYGDVDPAAASAASLHPWLAPGASPLTFDPDGSNQILVWCPLGVLTPTLTYQPRWLQDATDTGQPVLPTGPAAFTGGYGVGGYGVQPYGV